MKIYKTNKNFLGIADPNQYGYNEAQFVIQSAPYEHTSSYVQGSDKGPKEILKASHFVEFYDEELDFQATDQVGICTLKPYDFGNKVNLDALNFLYEQTLPHIQNGKTVVTLGAEHSITSALIRAHKEVWSDLVCVQIDAHSDLRMSYEGNPYSHASVMARVFEQEVPIYQVGIRAQCKEEAQLRKDHPERIKTWYAHSFLQDPIQRTQEIVEAVKGKNVYITLDADGFDPSVFPDVGTAEPNGLSWQQGTHLLKELAQHCHVVGFDFLEIAPQKNVISTPFNAAKLVYKLISYLTFYKQNSSSNPKL